MKPLSGFGSSRDLLNLLEMLKKGSANEHFQPKAVQLNADFFDIF